MEYTADEVGVLKMDMVPSKQLSTGEVGYIISGIKNATEVKVGDTVTHIENPCKNAIEGFQEVKPMVFAGVYPNLTQMITKIFVHHWKSYSLMTLLLPSSQKVLRL